MGIRIQHLPHNSAGRDFILADLHGEIHLLQPALAAVGFDASVDRVLSVGDLIDRGRNSPATLALLDEPWFYAVQGNHELMMINSVCFQQGFSTWMTNGGGWSLTQSPAWLQRQAARLFRLPQVLVVGSGAQRFHVVHAALVDAEDQIITDAQLDDVEGQQNLLPEMLAWTRWHARAYIRQTLGGPPVHPVHAPGLSPTFCGHTPIDTPGMLLSHYFLDGGVGYVFSEGAPKLNLIEASAVLGAAVVQRAG